MFSNYHYFLTLCEEMNITRAATRLYISHQSLSSYLRKLETTYGVSLFMRKPKFSLTPAGYALLNSLREVERIEKDFLNQIKIITDEKSGSINFGTTEGRYRMIVHPLLIEYSKMYPEVHINTFSLGSHNMENSLLNNQIDFFLGFNANNDSNKIKSNLITKEKLYMIISDNLLKKYFPDSFPQCKEEFSKGVDLKLFEDVPFTLNKQNFNSRILIENHLNKFGIKFNQITELLQPDIHITLSAADYAASFCFSGFISSITKLNKANQYESKLNVFPILNLENTRSISLFYLKDRIFPKYMLDFMNLINKLCHDLHS